jgi:serine/threonine protein phosphatase PrpC
MSDRAQAPSSDQETDGILLKLFGRTDVGQIREHNEDNFLIANLTKRRRSLLEEDRIQGVGTRGTALGVCDGMGGAAAGEVASQLAVDIIYERLVEAEPPPNNDELARRLVSAIEDAGVRIYNEARADRTRRGMGTTATIAVLMGPRMFVGQVGDSRAYVMREGELIQVTRDQSLVNQLIEAGQLTEEEAETFEHNNIILQALGTAETVQVDLTYVDLCRGDTLLLCSDGLSGMVRAAEIRDVLLEVPDPLEACKVLTERANLAGGHDNITVIVAHVSGDTLPEPGTVDAPAYRKHALPEIPAPDAPIHEMPVQPDSIQTGPISEEARRESRRLKVGHTMVGTPSPLVSPEPPPSRPTASPASSIPPPHSDAEDEEVQIPTTGLPPKLVGMLILGSLLLVAAIGFWLLR